MPSSTTPDESRLDSRTLNLECRDESARPSQDPAYYAGSFSTEFRGKGGIQGPMREGMTCVPGVVPVVTTWPAEEVPDGLMHGGLLWRESGFGRELEYTTEGVPQEIAGACRPVSE